MKQDTGKASGNPKWETAVMAVSFVLLWVWWLARQAAHRNETDLSPLWQVMLLTVVGVLVFIFVRRMKRTLEALRANQPSKNRRPEHN